MQLPSRRSLYAVLRIAGLASFAFYAVRQRELLEAVWHTVSVVKIEFLLVSTVLLLGSLALGSLRLSLLGQALGFTTSYLSLYLDSLRGTALNATTLMGAGEAYRAHRLAQRIQSSVAIGGSLILCDRLLGTLLLLVTGATAYLGRLSTSHVEHATAMRLVPLGLALLGAGVLLLGSVARKALAQVPQGAPAASTRKPVLAALGIGFASVLLWLGSVYSLAVALTIDVSPLTIGHVAPFVAFVTLLPISIGGLGVRETSYALLLKSSCSTAQASALGLLQYSTFLGVAVIGAAFFLLTRLRVQTQDSPRQ